jgi:hypothetical protein
LEEVSKFIVILHMSKDHFAVDIIDVSDNNDNNIELQEKN